MYIIICFLWSHSHSYAIILCSYSLFPVCPFSPKVIPSVFISYNYIYTHIYICLDSTYKKTWIYSFSPSFNFFCSPLPTPFRFLSPPFMPPILYIYSILYIIFYIIISTYMIIMYVVLLWLFYLYLNIENPTFVFKSFYYLSYIYACVCPCATACMQRSESTCRSWFSPSTRWVTSNKLKKLGLVACFFTSWAISTPHSQSKPELIRMHCLVDSLKHIYFL